VGDVRVEQCMQVDEFADWLDRQVIEDLDTEKDKR
jgi:hypothetical protein